ncbi:unnamed protein product [Symbiodinium natans]|uniref:C3H1-type domain-containing protein n=1 Tax=Symbiodinium natans TaxID=878477 RepID=A0A812MT67_9DINO|nr:unnamed protein product [Symbiodinium natans]
MPAASLSHEGHRVVQQNTFLNVVSDEDIELRALKWGRLSSWPCTPRSSHGDAAASEDVSGADPVVELAEAQSTEQDCKDCNPCIFLASSGGCLHGASCKFCHMHSAKKDGAAKKRARKQTRDKYKAEVLKLLGGNREEMQAQQDQLQHLAKNNAFVRAFALACLETDLLTTLTDMPDEVRPRVLQPGPVQRPR